jgi:L-alanine-DL-glutamate epimerase-like enolase superfamily enzyme
VSDRSTEPAGAGPAPEVRAQTGAIVESLAVEIYTVPTDQPEADGTIAWDATTVVVAKAAGGGEEGLGWTYAGAGCGPVVTSQLRGAVVGTPLTDVPAMSDSMIRACRNLGRPGVVSSAISAVDMALWDLKARVLGLPLCRLFGKCRESAPIYGSGGFTTYSDETTAAQLEQWVGEWGVGRVKIKIGESWGSEVGRDLERVALARSVIGPGCELFVDANGGYGRKQAIRVGRQLTEQWGVVWFEEPVSSDDLAGLREVRDQCRADVTAGEYGYDLSYFARMVEAEAVDCLQVDVTRCGGYSEWLRAAAVAASHSLQVSGHCAPNLHAHVAVAVPNIRHLEYFHDHHRIEHMLFDGALSPKGGALVPDLDRPGHGMRLKEPDAARYRVG